MTASVTPTFTSKHGVRRYARNDSGTSASSAASSSHPSDEAGAPDPLATMTQGLARVIEGVRADARDEAVAAIDSFTRQIEAMRSRRPPIPSQEEGRSEQTSRRARLGEDDQAPAGEYVSARDFRVLGDARDTMYRRMEYGRSGIGLLEFRRARNPRMDAIAADWARATAAGNVDERVRKYHELNDEWLKANGTSRAALLEGLPTGENPLSNGSGAELLPLPLSNQLMMERDKASKFRSLVNVFPMTAQVQRIPVLPTVTASARLEGAAYTDNTPAADSALLTARDIGVLFSAGRNFLEDSAFNIVQQLTVVAGGAIGAEEDIQIATSTANAGDITQGLDAATITIVAEQTADAIGFRDLVQLYYALPEQYRREAVFFAASTTLADLATILDGNGRPVLLNGMDAPRAISDFDPNATGTILGKRVYDVPVADDVIYFGNPMWYALGNRAGIRVDTDRAVTTGTRQWTIDERIDGRVIPTSVVGTNNAWRKIVY